MLVNSNESIRSIGEILDFVLQIFKKANETHLLLKVAI